MSYPQFNSFGPLISQTHLEIRDNLLRFAEQQLAPGAAARDQTHQFPQDQIDELAALGGMAMKVPVDMGGPGIDNVSYALCIEALSRYDASVAVVAVASNLSAHILANHASAEQQSRWVAPAAQGKLGALSFALTEPSAGSDAAGIRTTAQASGDEWILNGSKQWITGGSNARLFVVFVKTPLPNAPQAMTCFGVEAGTTGFSIGRVEDKMGLRSSGTAQLFFDDCRISSRQIIGKPGEGLKVALGSISASRVAIAAQSIGIAERAFELGLDYARERTAFGQSLSQFQNSRFVLADCRTELDQAWLLMLRAAHMLDADQNIRGEASMAKLAASETCCRVVDRMLQLHGGNGYSREYEIERLYRDARVMRIFEGTSEIQREVISRDLLDSK